MSSPSLKDLPKVALDLKSELEGFNHGCMKKAATAEKNVLPSAEGILNDLNGLLLYFFIFCDRTNNIEEIIIIMMMIEISQCL